MKKIYSYLSAAIAVVAVVACAKENVGEISTEQTLPVDAIEKTFSAALESSSKTVMSGAKSFWSETEDIAVLGQGKYQFTAILDAPSDVAEFKCESYSASETEVVAVYPYKDSYTVDLANKTVSNVVIPTIQYAPAGTYDSNGHIAIAYSSDGETLEFKNAVALFKFQPNIDNLKKVCLYVPEKSSGSVVDTGDVAFNNGSPTFTVKSGVKYVDVLPSTGTYFIKGETYYFAVMPGVYPDGFIFEIETSKKYDYMKTAKSQTLAANTVYDMGLINEPIVTIIDESNNWNMGANIAIKDGSYYVAKNVQFSKKSEFKVMIDGGYYRTIPGDVALNRWISIYKIDGNPSLNTGTYDIYINKNSFAICVVEAGNSVPAFNTTNSDYYIVMRHDWQDWDYMLYVSPNVSWGNTNAWPGIYCEGSFMIGETQYKYWKVASAANGKKVLFVFADYKDDGKTQTQQSKDVTDVALTSDHFYYLSSWDGSASKANVTEFAAKDFR